MELTDVAFGIDELAAHNIICFTAEDGYATRKCHFVGQNGVSWNETCESDTTGETPDYQLICIHFALGLALCPGDRPLFPALSWIHYHEDGSDKYQIHKDIEEVSKLATQPPGRAMSMLAKWLATAVATMTTYALLYDNTHFLLNANKC